MSTDGTTRHRVTVNGLDLYYELHGDGMHGEKRPLLLLHGGLMTAASTFRALLPALARSHPVVVVELQGHGHTADIDREPTLAAMSSDVVALLDHLGVQRADLFGFSFGGLVALETAITHPERVDRLVLAGVQVRPDGYHREILDPDAHAHSTRLPSEADLLRMVEEHRAVAPDPDHVETFARRLGLVVEEFAGWPAEVVRALASPTLLVIGDNDFVRIEHAAEMLELIPDAQLAVVPGASHLSLTSRAEIVLPAVERFLRRTTDTPG